MSKPKVYRQNVAAVILSSKYPFKSEIFLGRRIDYKGDIWQFPQGGIDEGESPQVALLRELKEEIGTDDIEIITEHPQWFSYDFPNIVASKMYPYDGQTQKYFLVRLNSGAKIDLQTKDPEFSRYKFVDYDDVLESIGSMKRDIYKKVMSYFKKSGYL
jgi:putative (di)nucleoside polyphosphate hydrolase